MKNIQGFVERSLSQIEVPPKETTLDIGVIAWLRLPHTERFMEYLQNLARERTERAKSLSKNDKDSLLEMRQALREVVLLEEIIEYARRNTTTIA